MADPQVEQRARLLRGWALCLAALLLGALVALFPPARIPVAGHRLLCVLLPVILLWVTEALPLGLTGLLGVCAAAVVGVAPVKSVFSEFGNPILFLFVGSFLLARALEQYGLDRSFAAALLSSRAARRSPWGAALAIGLVSFALSSVISNSAATAIVTPIAIGVAAQVLGKDAPREQVAPFLLLVTFGASTGGLVTPVGTPPNLIGIGLIESATGHRISFFEWMLVGLPIGGISLVLLAPWMLRGVRKAVSAGDPGAACLSPSALPVAAAAAELPGSDGATAALVAGRRGVLFAFLAAMVLWILPGVVALCYGSIPILEERLHESIAALVAAGLLFLLPGNSRSGTVLDWEEMGRIDWGTILLFGSGMALGSLAFSTGLVGWVADRWGHVAPSSLWGLTAAAILLSLATSELTSNTATANLILPLIIGLAKKAGVDPLPPALAACLAASFGFMFPVSTGPNAIVYGTGLVPLRSMIRNGILLDLIGAAVIWCVLRVVLPFVRP